MLKNDINSIFATEYWIMAAAEFQKLRTLVFAAVTIALGIVMSLFYIPVGENLRISFAFLVLVLDSMVFGPIVGLVAGVAYDLIGSLIVPTTIFFPGYTLSIMLEFFIYGLFLYRKQISILRIFLAKFLVDYGIHVGLGSLWSKILFAKGYYYFFIKSLVKNSIMLPLEVIMLVVMLRIFLPILVREGVIPKPKKKHIPLI